MNMNKSQSLSSNSKTGERKRKKSTRSQVLEKNLENKLQKSTSVELRQYVANGGIPKQCKCNKCHPGSNTDQQTDKKNEKEKSRNASVFSDLDSCSRTSLKFRARSWPLLLTPQGGEKGSNKEANGFASPIAHVRKLLWRHYYPEGGWGYVVVACSVLVQILNHGFQLAYGVLQEHLLAKFKVEIKQTGKLLYFSWMKIIGLEFLATTNHSIFLDFDSIIFNRRILKNYFGYPHLVSVKLTIAQAFQINVIINSLLFPFLKLFRKSIILNKT